MSASRITCRVTCVSILLAVAAAAIADPVDDFVRQELKRQRIPGIAIGIVRDGKLTKAKGYGVADLDHGVPVTADTVFALASITKQFTSSLVMMLVEEGKVSLDDKVSKYLDNPPEAWSGITVWHLLNHTAGLAPLGQDFKSLVRTMNGTTAQLYEAAKNDLIGGKPGEQWSYSDVGYFLLGMVIEKATGKKYEDVLSERILRPLKMDTARMLDLDRPYENLAKGYTLFWTGNKWETFNIRRDMQRELTSHYGLFGSVKDLAKWDAALYTDSILKQSSLKQMWTPAVLNDGSTFPYGFGWNIESRNGHEYVFHSGITGTFFLRIPSLRLSVIVLTNLGRWASGNSRGCDPLMIARGIAALVEPKFRLNPISGADPARMAKGREAVQALAAGTTPQSLFSDVGVGELVRYLDEYKSDLGPLGAVVKVEALEMDDAFYVLRFTFQRGQRTFAIAFDKDGKVEDIFADA